MPETFQDEVESATQELSAAVAIAIADATAPLKREMRQMHEQIADLNFYCRQLGRAPQPDYYTSHQLMDLAQRKTPAALHSWCQRNGIPSKGHHQWCRTSANTVLGIHE